MNEIHYSFEALQGHVKKQSGPLEATLCWTKYQA